MTVERPFLLTFVIRITVFVQKREKLIPIILYIYAAVDPCSATFYYFFNYKYITGSKSAQCTLKCAAAVSHGIPRICGGEPRNLAKFAAENCGPYL